MSSVFTGIVLIGVCSILMIAMLIRVLVKICKIKASKFERIYKNRNLIIWFYVAFLIILPGLLAPTIAFAVLTILQNNLNLTNDEKLSQLKLIFNILYLVYTIFILANLLMMGRFTKSLIIVEHENNYLFLDGTIINKDKIRTITHNLKRTVLMIAYYDPQDVYEVMVLSYNFRLKDWLSESTALEIKLTPQ
ncbi:hypothetical protein [Spiroplasma clarkii]|uniref:Transmembrane protein n=2 Tax=Spiroplasma clarkii TaxID=2139 RepID=A0A2K8KMT3_9MOLU|nr:hypothetical protein [Spiroplasma clarkii]ATX70904.1 hypothetical protein SCLAR_v1c05850 [Spiroplasma clarkii]